MHLIYRFVIRNYCHLVCHIFSFGRLVPFGVNNKFGMPCDITFWGDAENREYVVNELKRYGFKFADYSKRSGSLGLYDPGFNLSAVSGPLAGAPTKISANVVSPSIFVYSR